MHIKSFAVFCIFFSIYQTFCRVRRHRNSNHLVRLLHVQSFRFSHTITTPPSSSEIFNVIQVEFCNLLLIPIYQRLLDPQAVSAEQKKLRLIEHLANLYSLEKMYLTMNLMGGSCLYEENF